MRDRNGLGSNSRNVRANEFVPRRARVARNRRELVRDARVYTTAAISASSCPGMVFDFDVTGKLTHGHSCFLCSSQAKRLEDEADVRSIQDLVAWAD